MTTSAAAKATATALAQRVTVLRIEKIEPHPANVREDLGDLGDLARSIREQGILQPLTVQPHPTAEGRYRIIAGHRRFDAAQLAGLTAVPVIIRHGLEDAQVLELMLVENVQRVGLNPMEKAEAMAALQNRGYTQADIGRRTGLTSSTVSYYLSLMQLAPETQEKVRAGKLSAADAVKAVRTVRRQDRQKRTGSKVNPFEWEPDYLSETHPLARKARKTCDARDHGMRRRIGKIACGQCWETVIRLDERIVIEAEEASA
jgi:ParB family transcriptional regulator, chromosome partitioning protein